MNTTSAIRNRRSVEKYKDQPVEDTKIEELLEMSIKAPSARNRQPWNFVVLQGEPKQDLIDILHNKARSLKKEGEEVGEALSSVRTMRQAPVLILVYNPYTDEEELDSTKRSLDDQSTGAAIENLMLAATDMGLGSLWIGDILLAEEEISEWLEREDDLVAAVALGHSAEDPSSKPRADLEEIVSWLGEGQE